MANALPLPPSLWVATARAAPATPPLDASSRADVAIVGAGYSGLAAALQLAEAGVSVVVLESGEPGWGASGRNGGQVIPGLKFDPDELVAMFGPKAGEHLVDVAGGAADTVFDLIARHGIDCEARRCGWIQPAFAAADLGLIARRAEQWQRRGAPVAMLDRDTACRLIGSPIYHGGWIDRRAGSLQPLSYCRGLARAAQKAGALVCGGSRVSALARDGARWKVTTAHGPTVSAERVLLATNGYTGALSPWHRRRIIPIGSYIIATEPLPEALALEISPKGRSFFDTKNFLYYWHVSADRRMVFGGRASMMPTSIEHTAEILYRGLVTVHPQLAGYRIDYAWGGNVGFTFDRMPHAGRTKDGVAYAMGCCGTGVALMTHLGTQVGEWLTGGEAPALAKLSFPLVPAPYEGRAWFLPFAGEWFRLKDRLAARSRIKS